MKQHGGPVTQQVLSLNIGTSIGQENQVVGRGLGDALNPLIVVPENLGVASLPDVPE